MTPQKVSFVVAARNDDYGGNFLQRMQVFVSSLLELAREEKLSGELVVVEWNPPEATSSLRHALQWPSPPDDFAVRFVCVPKAIHLRHENADRMPMFEYIAKNVGIRRAVGDFVVSTNPDLLYSRELIRFLAASDPDPRCFYRVNRHDVAEPIPRGVGIDNQLAFCKRHTFLVNTVDGSVRPGWHPVTRAFAAFARSSRRVRKFIEGTPRERLDFGRARLHTNASGDFFMMARPQWHATRGYPELTTHSFIDGYICFMAASMGLEQRVLTGRRRIYHQDHGRAEHASRPITDYESYLKSCQAMLAAGRPEILNSDGWGLGEFELQEFEVTR